MRHRVPLFDSRAQGCCLWSLLLAGLLRAKVAFASIGPGAHRPTTQQLSAEWVVQGVLCETVAGKRRKTSDLSRGTNAVE